MEQQGYDVSYISNLDTHADPAQLIRAWAFLSVGHDEYWSLSMYEHVRQAIAAGVHGVRRDDLSGSGEQPRVQRRDHLVVGWPQRATRLSPPLRPRRYAAGSRQSRTADDHEPVSPLSRNGRGVARLSASGVHIVRGAAHGAQPSHVT